MDLAQTFSWIAAGLIALVLLEVMRREVPRGLAPALTTAVAASLVFAVGDALWRRTSVGNPPSWPALLLMWVGVASVPPAWWILALRFAEHHGESFRWSRSVWAWAPAVAQCFFYGLLLTNPWHGLFLTPAPQRSQFHAIAWVQASVTYATLVATIAVYVWLAARARSAETRSLSRSMALGSGIPALANFAYVAWPRPLAVDPTMVAITLSSATLVYLITRRQLFSLSPLAFSAVRRQDTDAVLLLDAHGRLIDANPASRALLGGLLDDDQDALLRIAKALTPQADPDEDRHALAARFGRGLDSPGELFALGADPPRLLRITSLALAEARGRASAVLLRARDETALADANARARSRAALLEAVFEAAGVAVAVLDRQGRLRFVNGLMERVWRFSLSGKEGASARDLLRRQPPRDPGLGEQLRATIERASRDHESVLREDFALSDGRVIELVSVPMRGDGVDNGRLFLSADVTERRRHESAAREAARLDDLSRLAGGVAHGFNNLLSAVLGNAELALMGEPVSARTARHLSEVREAAQRGAVLANQLLAYAGRAPLRRVRVDVAGWIEREVAALRRELPPSSALRVELPPELPPVSGDGAQLAHALGVLLRNAAEALPEGVGEIAVTARAEGAEVVIRVCDDGVGMDAATLARAFEPFFSTKPKAKGLGLAAARGIVAQHGGTLAAESAPRAGAVLTLRLPCERDETSRALPPERELAVPAPWDAWRASGRILVVDDELPTLRVSRELTEALGFESVAADRPSAALAAWRAAGGAIRVALIDATMPEYDGPELLRRLRLEAPNLPAVIYSGFARESFELPEHPPTEFLHKPFTLDALASALRRVLQEDEA